MVRSWVATAANDTRNSTAPAMPQKDDARTERGRHTRGGEADDDRVVAGQHQVNEDNLPEGEQLLTEVHRNRPCLTLALEKLDHLVRFDGGRDADAEQPNRPATSR